MKQYLAIMALALTTFSCNLPQKSLGDQEITLFQKQPLNFNPAENKTNLEDSIILVADGRIALRKITLPKYHKEVKASIEVEIVSAGDPWDKTGSLFLIPQSSKINFLTQPNDFNALFANQTEEDFFPAITTTGNYVPSLEILRFMTPFGVGHYSNDPKLALRKPVYIPKWEEKVTWTQDVTPLLSELEGEVWIGAFVDVWTKEGYQISAKLIYEESKAQVHAKTETSVLPLVNTTCYTGPQKLYDKFSRAPLNVTFTAPTGYKSAKLYYITTGHGGHSGGDEFVQKENIVSVNDQILYNEIPWRDDCASFRRFNPHSGVWTEKRLARTGNLRTGDTKEQEIDEFIASSDYSRSNWCPGSKVEPIVMELNNLQQGENKLTISIPKAQPAKEQELNHWNVSAYIVFTR